MDNQRADQLIDVLERIADVLEGKQAADERRLRQKYERSVEFLKRKQAEAIRRTTDAIRDKDLSVRLLGSSTINVRITPRPRPDEPVGDC